MPWNAVDWFKNYVGIISERFPNFSFSSQTFTIHGCSFFSSHLFLWALSSGAIWDTRTDRCQTRRLLALLYLEKNYCFGFFVYAKCTSVGGLYYVFKYRLNQKRVIFLIWSQSGLLIEKVLAIFIQSATYEPALQRPLGSDGSDKFLTMFFSLFFWKHKIKKAIAL